MQYFLQVFDDEGMPQLKGDNNFQSHIGWVTLLGWEPNPHNYREIYFTLPTSPITIMLEKAANDGTRNWVKATFDMLSESGWWIRRWTFVNPRVVSVQTRPGDNPAATVTTVSMVGSGSSIDYSGPARIGDDDDSSAP